MRVALIATFLAGALATAAFAPTPPNFAGAWLFQPAESRNIGMMAGAHITTTIRQTSTRLIVTDRSQSNGQSGEETTTYDLTGSPTHNRSVMGDPSLTTTTWQGDRLVTRWESPGAVAGTTVVRIETRYLTDGGKRMVLESRRGSSPPIVMVFTRQ